MNIPNMLTLLRFFFVPLFSIVFLNNNIHNNYWVALVIFIFSGLTDILDGFIARKYNMITRFGTLMDPLADKLMILTVLFCFYIRGILPIWVFCIIFLKEFAMLLGATRLYKMEIVIPSNIFGKAATVAFYIAIVFGLFRFKNTIILFVIAIIMAIVAFINYGAYYLKIKRKISK